MQAPLPKQPQRGALPSTIQAQLVETGTDALSPLISYRYRMGIRAQHSPLAMSPIGCAITDSQLAKWRNSDEDAIG
jgi:hypothetical protein